MSFTNSNNDQPRASTSKDGVAEPRVSLTATFREPPPRVHPAELRRQVVVAPPPAPAPNDSGFFAASASSLAKLQTYLPTGTWVTYTALETWAFSLRPNDAPVSPTSNCNSHQRIALFIVLSLSTFLAFFTSFVKRFIYDAPRTHVLYPPPGLFSVAHPVTDPVTGVQFPCRTREKRYCWPLVGGTGELVYDETGTRLRVLVFKMGVQVHVKRKVWARRWFQKEEAVPDAPRLCTPTPTSPRSKHMSLASTITPCPPNSASVEIDDIAATAPVLEPRWTRAVVGALGSRAYLDFRPCVWGHAIVSVLAFLTLALFSTQVCGCLYPSIPDYLPSTLQTGMLALLSFIAAVFVRDDAVSLGQMQTKTVPAVQHSDADSDAGSNVVPEHLRAVAEMLVWVGRQDFDVGQREKM